MNTDDIITVKELIEMLKEIPGGLPVLVSGYESGFEHFYMPTIQKLKHEPDNMYFDGEYQLANTINENSIDAVVLQRMVRDD